MKTDMVIYKTSATAVDDEEAIEALNAIQSACDTLRKKDIRSATVLRRIGELDLKLIRRTIRRIRRTKKRYVVRSVPFQPPNPLAEHVQKRMNDFVYGFGQSPHSSDTFEGLESLVATGHQADNEKAEAQEEINPFLVVYKNKDGIIESRVYEVSHAVFSANDISRLEHKLLRAGYSIPKREWTLWLSTNDGLVASFSDDDVIASGWVQPGSMVCFRKKDSE